MHRHLLLLLIAVSVPAASEPGLEIRCWEGRFQELPFLPGLGKPAKQVVMPGFTLDAATRSEDYVLAFSGCIDLPETGLWTFAVGSDDGARLYIDGRRLVDNDGLHDAAMKSGDPVELKGGRHAVLLTYFQASGGSALFVNWKGPGMAESVAIPAAALTHDPTAKE